LEAGGWKTVRIFHQRILANFIASTGYWLQDHGILPRLSDKLGALPESRGRLKLFFLPLGLSPEYFWSNRAYDCLGKEN